MRVSDYIARFIYDQGIDTVFFVSGGGAIFLDDGLACNNKLVKVCCHHEQAAGMSAVGYAKYKGFGCAYVTTGCGGSNVITAVLHAWQDSVPCIFISGQVKRSQTTRNSGLALRQFGVQEADIISLISPITKYVITRLFYLCAAKTQEKPYKPTFHIPYKDSIEVMLTLC